MKKSFTLIELLVVIAIIGLLVIIIAIPINRVRRGASIARILQYEASLHRYLGSDIVGWWQFNEGEGSIAKDISGYSNDGTIHGATYVDGVPGKEGYALEFDGVGDYVNLKNKFIPIIKNFTFSGWVNAPEDPMGSSHGTFFAQGLFILYSYTTYGTANGNIRLFIGGTGEIFVGPDIRGDGWKHVILTRDNDIFKLFVNGIEISQSNWTGSIPTATNTLLGIWNFNSDYAHNGLISDIRIYSRALTSEEINTLYAETKDKYIVKD